MGRKKGRGAGALFSDGKGEEKIGIGSNTAV